MNQVSLLETLRDVTMEATSDLLMPVAWQREDQEKPPDRVAGVYLMRLPDSKAATKKAPYILHQVVTGKDQQSRGENDQSRTTVRSIFCVYNEDEQAGALTLLNLMERLRICLLRSVVIGDQFELDKEAGVDTLVYPDDTAPYFAGEMVTVWQLPAVEREVRAFL